MSVPCTQGIYCTPEQINKPKHMCHKIHIIWCRGWFSSYLTKWSLEYASVGNWIQLQNLNSVTESSNSIDCTEHACVWTHTIPRKKKNSKFRSHAGIVCFTLFFHGTQSHLGRFYYVICKNWNGTQINIKSHFCPYLTATFVYCSKVIQPPILWKHLAFFFIS